MKKYSRSYYMAIKNLTEEEIRELDLEWLKFNDFVDTFKSKHNLEITRSRI